MTVVGLLKRRGRLCAVAIADELGNIHMEPGKNLDCSEIDNAEYGSGILTLYDRLAYPRISSSYLVTDKFNYLGRPENVKYRFKDVSEAPIDKKPFESLTEYTYLYRELAFRKVTEEAKKRLGNFLIVTSRYPRLACFRYGEAWEKEVLTNLAPDSKESLIRLNYIERRIR